MELTGNLKDKVSDAKTKEEVKELIEDAGMSLTDEELDQVAGGIKTVKINDGNNASMTGKIV